MGLKFALFKNLLVKDKDAYRAIVHGQKSIDMSQLIDDMVAEGTGLTRPQALAYSEKLFSLCERYIQQGYRVNLPVVSIYTRIKGVFYVRDEHFNPARHQVVVCVSASSRLRLLGQTIGVELVKTVIPAPVPEVFIDIASGIRNKMVTPGNIAALRGSMLNFNMDDPAQGLYFSRVDNPSVVYRVAMFSAIKPSEVSFLIPDLPPGDYHLEVRALVKRSKTVQGGILDQHLTVY